MQEINFDCIFSSRLHTPNDLKILIKRIHDESIQESQNMYEIILFTAFVPQGTALIG